MRNVSPGAGPGRRITDVAAPGHRGDWRAHNFSRAEPGGNPSGVLPADPDFFKDSIAVSGKGIYRILLVGIRSDVASRRVDPTLRMGCAGWATGKAGIALPQRHTTRSSAARR